MSKLNPYGYTLWDIVSSLWITDPDYRKKDYKGYSTWPDTPGDIRRRKRKRNKDKFLDTDDKSWLDW
jgi:hypothetical protein